MLTKEFVEQHAKKIASELAEEVEDGTFENHPLIDTPAEQILFEIDRLKPEDFNPALEMLDIHTDLVEKI